MLTNLQVKPGDRVLIYLPLIPEAVVAMLACARIGAVHSVVFGGFSAQSLKDRMIDCGASVIITADGGYRKGQKISLKANVNEACKEISHIKHIVVVERIKDNKIEMSPGRDLFWTQEMRKYPGLHQPYQAKGEHPLFILYTSGTTGKPKGLVHTSAGYLLGTTITSRYIFDFKENDRYWCTADVGWITGHSYTVYSPLSLGATVFLCRTKKCPIIDTWWQTETGAAMITPIPFVTALKPGSATQPFFGIEPRILQKDGKPTPQGESGFLCIQKPWPSMARTIYGDHKRYVKTYWREIEGYYFTGDGAYQDSDGFIWINGRIDDVVNISGHRLGTAEVESAIVLHPAVAESAVVGKPDSIKGQSIVAFVTLKNEKKSSENLKQEIIKTIEKEIGSLARPDDIYFVDALPKTRSGKIIRRLLRELAASGQIKGDTSTLEDLTTLENIQEQFRDAG